jgi:hypothetical protein
MSWMLRSLAQQPTEEQQQHQHQYSALMINNKPVCPWYAKKPVWFAETITTDWGCKQGAIAQLFPVY